MTSKKSDKAERASPAAARSPIERRDPASMPGAAGRPSGRKERGDLRDLLGDYTEQTGAHFG